MFSESNKEDDRLSKENLRLKSAVEELSILNDIATAIASTQSLNQITKLIVKKCIKHLKAEQGSIQLVDEKDFVNPFHTMIRVRDKLDNKTLRFNKIISDLMIAQRKPLRINEFRAGETIELGEQTELRIKSLLSVPMIIKGKMIGILSLFNKESSDGFTEADQRLLTIIAGQSASVIENSRLFEEEKQLLQIQQEIQVAREIQKNLLPKEIPSINGYDISAMNIPAHEVGGDYYDYCIDGSGRISFAIGDATGHGAQAGALVTAAKVMFSCWSEDEDVTKFINQTSKTIKQLGLPQLFMAMVAGKIDNNKIEFAGSGLPPALIHKAITGTLEEIPLKGFPLGCVASYEYKKNCVMLNRGDTLLFMTDGFPELFNSNKDLLGYEKIKNAFCEVVNETPDKIVNYLKRMIDNWCDGFPLQDDVTFLLFKVKSHNDKAKQIIYNKF